MSKQITVSALEYVALCNVAKLVKIAMHSPNVGDLLVGALQVLDAVREDEGIAEVEIDQPVQAPQHKLAAASALTMALIDRAKS
jgi:hypothetical protein